MKLVELLALVELAERVERFERVDQAVRAVDRLVRVVGLRLSEPRRAPWIRGAVAPERHGRVPLRPCLRGRPDG
ncbi:hypothetical protein, partial [Streptomyces sp. T21Q-yed]|uniref:hypothetical protein n=1 Tax=Streptomyces sp. T21Q-yed TaxID=3018441 RepID=UPI0023E02532